MAAGEREIEHASELLRSGKLVAFPTETVYGLGADATNDRAVAAVYEAKGRPTFNPLISHVVSLGQAQKLGKFNRDARTLAKAFWPWTVDAGRSPDGGLCGVDARVCGKSRYHRASGACSSRGR